MKLLASVAIALALATAAARADSCDKSRAYLLADLGGDLPLSPQAYRDLFKICLATAAMTNVRDAYILKDGAIAVIAKQNSVAATAATLSQFCDAYPRSSLHFLTQKELREIQSIAGVVKTSSTSSTSCQKIKGLS
jgi:sulfur relay (sulfurtransferase) DsrF/TusC family protein